MTARAKMSSAATRSVDGAAPSEIRNVTTPRRQAPGRTCGMTTAARALSAPSAPGWHPHKRKPPADTRGSVCRGACGMASIMTWAFKIQKKPLAQAWGRRVVGRARQTMENGKSRSPQSPGSRRGASIAAIEFARPREKASARGCPSHGWQSGHPRGSHLPTLPALPQSRATLTIGPSLRAFPSDS